MLDKFVSFIKFIDIYGYDINFRYEGHLKYRSKVGGVSSLLCGIFVIYVFAYFSRDCFNKTNPTTREGNYYNTTIHLDASSYFFGFYFTDDLYNQMDDPEKYLAFYAVLTNWNETKQQRSIKFSKCDYKRHFSRSGMTEEKVNASLPFFDGAFCLNVDDDFYLMNGVNEIPRISMQIFVVECQNKTMHGLDCKIKLN